MSDSFAYFFFIFQVQWRVGVFSSALASLINKKDNTLYPSPFLYYMHALPPSILLPQSSSSLIFSHLFPWNPRLPFPFFHLNFYSPFSSEAFPSSTHFPLTSPIVCSSSPSAEPHLSFHLLWTLPLPESIPFSILLEPLPLPPMNTSSSLLPRPLPLPHDRGGSVTEVVRKGRRGRWVFRSLWPFPHPTDD